MMMVSDKIFALFFSFAGDFLYPIFRAVSHTFCMVSSEKDTSGLLLKIMETVDWETPSTSAISLVVTLFLFPILFLSDTRTASVVACFTGNDF